MKYIYLIITALFLSAQSFAQGCSDAGFCSLGVLKNNVDDAKSTTKHTLSFGASYGIGEQSTYTYNPYAEYGAKINDRFAFSTKITATYATGFLGHAFDVGDVFGSLVYSPKLSSTDNSLSFIGGVKLPLTVGNDKNSDGRPLSLDYQSSIGTFDAIGGVNYIVNKNWEFDAGLQVPVYNNNKSTYFPDEYTDPRAEKFAPTNNFRRKSDVLGRVGYYIRFSDSFILKPNLLGVYHLGNDSYEDRFGKRQTIYNSNGLTLNGALTGVQKFKGGNSLEVIVATPFIARKIRPDGLTREFVLNVQYNFAW